MKKLIILLALLTTASRLLAQHETLAMDEHNKYIYYQVQDMPGKSKAALYEGVLAGLKKNYKYASSAIITEGDTAFTVKSKLVIYSGQTLVKHEDGEVAYILRMEFKGGKYRYYFTDFVYRPFQRNRYGVTAAVPGGELPLEAARQKLDKNVFDNYRDQIIKYCKQLGDNTQFYAADAQKPAETVRKIDTRKW